jgi:glycogen operon protein
MKSVIRVQEGRPFPLGATVVTGGVNFALFSQHATKVQLVIYADEQSEFPEHVVALEPQRYRDRFIWHVLVEGLAPGAWFTWRVDGPALRSAGHAFDARRELLDPNAQCVSALRWNGRFTNDCGAIRGQVVADEAYDWSGDQPLSRPIDDEIIYELHVDGFTRHGSAGVAAPGTFAGLSEKIPYLKTLGVTALELLPVMAFDVLDVPRNVFDHGHQNYWGYSTIAFKALHPRYSSSTDARREFRDLVKALHDAEIAVILDVVFNHTAEGGPNAPALSFRGIDNQVYYHLDPQKPSRYIDYTGCGNTLNCNHPVVSQFIVDCLEYWVREFHVDGFRLDLASVLTRDEAGEADAHARVIWQIEQSPLLRERILIAEPWDAVGLHQVGSFPGFAWSEWNDRYRDIVRGFLRGDGGLIGDVATRLAGSSDLYAHAGKRPRHSINFVTCHDGFTLADLVSYNEKHNESNGEGSADGHNHNVSWNSGAEGITDNPHIVKLRNQRVRNFMTVLLLSQGVPMLNAGDERLRSQRGNNNAWCQNNELSWVDWTDSDECSAMVRFTREMIALRQRHASLRRRQFIVADDGPFPALHWFSFTLDRPDWHDPESRVLCYRLAGCSAGEPALCVLMNMDQCAHRLPLPEGVWKRVVDTSLDPPQDIIEPSVALEIRSEYEASSHSVVVFEAA